MVMRNILQEYLTYDAAGLRLLNEDNGQGGKDLYMKGICIQGDQRNANQRIYPVIEISNAVQTLNDQITGGFSVLGEIDHPDELTINLDRVSHMITEMHMDGANGHGTLRILPTPMGKVIETMLGAGVKLGVSSRGSGNVNAATGYVSEFEIITVDIVAQPSAKDAFPRAVYESMMNVTSGYKALNLAKELPDDKQAQRYLKEEIIRVINRLKWNK